MIPWFWMVLVAGADDDEREEHEGFERGEHEGGEREGGEREGGEGGGARVAAVTDPTWASECGSCHLAYPPGLLPGRSWTRILGNLGAHYGEDATVDAATRDRLVAYAVGHAADVATDPLSRAIARATVGTTPDRILSIGWLRHEHGEAPPGRVTSMSACGSCHPNAAAGRFDEGEIRIPPRPAPAAAPASPPTPSPSR
ncbi:MAG: diacylglycerol kinase [Myxococcota bacterium]